MQRRARTAALGFTAALAIAGGAFMGPTVRAAPRLDAALRTVVQVDPSRATNCTPWAAQRPLVVLALGQSNAGNHGEMSAAGKRVNVVDGASCAEYGDPLPGGTGRGGSIWSRLPGALANAGYARPVVVSVLGVDATSIAQWTDPHSPLTQRLQAQVRAMTRVGLAPDLVLWQQGEMDAQLGTPADEYRARLLLLAKSLADAGFSGPVLLAKSTVCRSPPAAQLHAVVDDLVSHRSRFRVGADTDALVGPLMRHDGCHFTAAGLSTAARLWAERILLVVGVAAHGPASSPQYR